MMQKNKTLIPIETYRKNVLSVIENWTKKTSVGWLRKQRDGVIGYLEERIKELKDTTEERIEELEDIAKELTKLNDEIYEIEYSIYTTESDNESKNESKNECDNESDNEGIKKIPELKPGMIIGKYKYMGLCNSPGEELIFDNDAKTFQINKNTEENN